MEQRQNGIPHGAPLRATSTPSGSGGLQDRRSPVPRCSGSARTVVRGHLETNTRPGRPERFPGTGEGISVALPGVLADAISRR